MAADGEVIVLGKGNVVSTTRFYSAGGWSALGGKTRDALGAYHRQFPLRLGAPKEELRSRLILTPQVFNDALVLLNKGGVTTERGALVGLPDHRPTLSDADAKAVDDYIKLLESDPYSPPTDSPLHAEIVSLLDDEGKVVKVSDNVVFASSAYKEMVDKISAHINEHGEVTVADVRDLFGTSRKYALALMDHMDHQRITRRVGDARVLR
jgi:selenocysteine-specific elongation factor